MNGTPIRLRQDIEIFPQEEGNFYLRDPKALRFFELGPEEGKIVQLLRTHEPKEILEQSSYDSKSLKKFLSMLKNWGLLESTKPPARRTSKKMRLIQMLFQKVVLLKPDKPLEFFVNKFSFLFSSFALIFYSIFCIFGFLQMLAFGDDFLAYKRPLLNDSLVITVIVFFIILFIIGMLHELAHGIVLKKFGGSIPELGIYLKYFSPALYIDLSDLYKMKKREHKVLILLAGPLLQAFIGFLSFFLWEISDPYSPEANFFHLTVFAAFFSLAVNLNPLVRLDGYFALQSMLNIYSLRRRAWDFIVCLCTKKPSKEELTFREKQIFLLYAPISILYTFMVLSLIMKFYFFEGFKNVPTLTIFCAIVLLITIHIKVKPKAVKVDY